ncbi:phosphoribosyl-AMP cyclohydrolase [Candidatus Poriferisodalis sp.]|uniref:phosphoribosyl-AMP cyclohydrolase n=1 Tax=Candidatus Poriferisodalis sp. TaxID=3101277 RepID=UPI003C70276B
MPDSRTDIAPQTEPALDDLEKGTVARIDFGKVAQIGRDSHQVVPVVLQDVDTGDVLFIGYANDEALRLTLERRSAVLYSTSRNEIWHKGATSGDTLSLVDVRVNCEQNSLLYRVRRDAGGACHTRDASGSARPGCYYRALDDSSQLRHLNS